MARHQVVAAALAVVGLVSAFLPWASNHVDGLTGVGAAELGRLMSSSLPVAALLGQFCVIVLLVAVATVRPDRRPRAARVVAALLAAVSLADAAALIRLGGEIFPTTENSDRAPGLLLMAVVAVAAAVVRLWAAVAVGAGEPRRVASPARLFGGIVGGVGAAYVLSCLYVFRWDPGNGYGFLDAARRCGREQVCPGTTGLDTGFFAWGHLALAAVAASTAAALWLRPAWPGLLAGLASVVGALWMARSAPSAGFLATGVAAPVAYAGAALLAIASTVRVAGAAAHDRPDATPAGS